jgi:hypothetical protein
MKKATMNKEEPARRNGRPRLVDSSVSLDRSVSLARSVAPALLLLLACAAGEAHAKTIYVSPSGNDGNPGTITQPVATPHQAMDMTAAGDTVYLRGGRYNLRKLIWISKPGIIFASYPGERALLVGGTNEDESTPESIIIVVASNVSVVGLEIQGGSYYGVKVDLDGAESTTGVAIRNCYIHHTGRDGIKTFNADRLLIEDCEIGHTGLREPNAEGIDSIGSIGIVIRRVYIHDTASSGVYLKGGARDGLIEQCRIENAGNSGLLFGQDTDKAFMRDGTRYEAINCLARNNVIVNTEGAGIGTYSGNNVRFFNNTVINAARTNHAGFYVVMNNSEQPARRVQFKNNIVVMMSERPMVFVINLADKLVSDSNIWFRPGGGAYKFFRESRADAGSYWKHLSEWQKGMGADSRSVIADPKLDAASLYRPLAASPAVDRAETLVDVMTDHAGKPRPQGRRSDIGAHESPFRATGSLTVPPAEDEAGGLSEDASEDGNNSDTLIFPVIVSASGGCVLLAAFLCRSSLARRRK